VVQGLVVGTIVAIASALLIAFVAIATSLHCDLATCHSIARVDRAARLSQSATFFALTFFALVLYNIVRILQNLVVGIITTERRKVKRQLRKLNDGA
jgi:sulfite exporter TauE/SafE